MYYMVSIIGRVERHSHSPLLMNDFLKVDLGHIAVFVGKKSVLLFYQHCFFTFSFSQLVVPTQQVQQPPTVLYYYLLPNFPKRYCCEVAQSCHESATILLLPRSFCRDAPASHHPPIGLLLEILLYYTKSCRYYTTSSRYEQLQMQNFSHESSDFFR